MPMSAEAVSLRQFAAMNGWAPSHAHRLKVAGRLVLVSEGGRELVHVSRSMERIAESSSPQKGYNAELNARQRERHRTPAPPVPPASPPAAPPVSFMPSASDSETPAQQSRNATYNQARTAREVFEAKLAQLKYEQEVGKLVDAEKVRAEFGRQITTVRDQLLQLPERLAPMLLGQTDLETVKRTLKAEIRGALSQFAEATA